MFNRKNNLNATVLQILILILIVALVGCGKGGKKQATQVAAKVDGTEISILQINQVMQGLKNVPADNVEKVRKEILDKLIDQQILVDKATRDNLDRTPEVVSAVEAAKKEILARAYVNRLVSTTVRVSDEDIKKYYDDNPALFSKRRVYSIQDIGMAKDGQIKSMLEAEISKGKSLQDIAEFLKAQNVKFSAGSFTRPAEQMPMQILPNLLSLADGQTVVLDTGEQMHVIHLSKSQDAPITINTATPFIKNYYINIRGKEMLASEMKKMRQQAKVEYVGSFASATESTNQQNEVNSINTPKDKSQSDIEKGVAGLK